MKILIITPYHDYGFQERGPGYDFMNMERGLVEASYKFGWEVDIANPDKVDFCWNSIWQEYMEEAVVPDIVIENYYQGDLEAPMDFLEYLKRGGSTVCRWDSDSHKRFADIYESRERYDVFITADPRMVPYYNKYGLKVVSSMFAAGPGYMDLDLERDIDVSFIGQPYGIREEALRAVQAAGINVRIFGRGWNDIWGHKENDELIDEEYIKYTKAIGVLNRSKISLNFADVNTGGLPSAFLQNVKGRHFEIPACGACQVSTPCDILSDYFVPGSEIIIVGSVNDMIARIEQLLDDDKWRREIAEDGKARVDKDHRWSHRYADIVKEITS